MTGTISEVLAAVVAIQESLTIASPASFEVTKAYPFPPGGQHALPGPRTWFNGFSMLPVSPARMMTMRALTYQVHMQFFAAKSTQDVENGQQIALAFWEALLEALYPMGADPETFRLAQSLGGVCTRATLRGGMPETLTILVWGNDPYIGLDCYLDVEINESWMQD